MTSRLPVIRPESLASTNGTSNTLHGRIKSTTRKAISSTPPTSRSVFPQTEVLADARMVNRLAAAAGPNDLNARTTGRRDRALHVLTQPFTADKVPSYI